MRSRLWKLTLRIKRKSYLTQISIFYLSSFAFVLFVLPFIYLTDKILGENSNGPEAGAWIATVLVTPFFETFLFQRLPFNRMQNWSLTRNKYGLYILVSSVIFGLCHYYSLQYMMITFAGGLVLAYTYFFYCKTPKVAFCTTVLIHGLRNSMALIALIFDKR